jgi:glycerate kinase
MKVVIAIDSFKGSLDSLRAGEAARAGVLAADPGATVVVVAIADGGEGTLAALLAANKGKLRAVETVDPLGQRLTAHYGIFGREGRQRAVLECARTIGLHLVPVDSTLPERANSYGFGQQLIHALDSGVEEVLVSLGGSATTDGGSGVLLALGARVLDEAGHPIGPGENPLWRFSRLDISGMRQVDTRICVLSDVTNPLTGPRGAAAVFGPQKGANPQQVAHLDVQMNRWAESLTDVFGRSLADTPGAGAAGGLGATFLALGAHIEPGFERVAAELGLASTLAGADLVLTGEGSLDAQTAHGKVTSGIAQMAVGAGALVVAVAGRVDRPLGEMSSRLNAAFGIHSEARSLAQALDPTITSREIEATSFEVTRLVIAAGMRSCGTCRE